jgi:hypothetical protein
MNNSNTNNNVNTNVKSNITSLNNNNINNNNLNNNNNGNFNNGSNKKKTVFSVNPWSNGEDDEDLDRFGNKKAKSNNNPTLSCPPSINTPKKMHFLNILVGQYNFPQHEVVRAIESIGDGPDIDLEIILGIIMSMQFRLCMRQSIIMLCLTHIKQSHMDY